MNRLAKAAVMDIRSLQITAYQARNFKPFLDTGLIKIKPITLLFGHNSSGKSALLSILPMLQQTVEDPNLDTPFVFSSDTGVDLGMYDEVIYKHKVSLQTPIWFKLELSASTELGRRILRLRSPALANMLRTLEIKGKKLTVEIAASYNKKRRRISIIDFLVKDGIGKTIFRTFRKTTAANQRWHFEPESMRDQDLRLSWSHFLPRPRIQKTTDKPLALSELMIFIHYAIEDQLRGLVHIGPVRDLPRRAYRLTGTSPRDVGQTGENWLSIFLQVSGKEELAKRVNSWLRRLGYTLRIEWGKQGYVHPRLVDNTGIETSLKDVGFGISQVLPMLIQGFSSRPGTILILEQPEIHLHPRAQAELGNMLLAIARRGVRLLIETHSEHLLLRLQRRMAETKLRPNTEMRLRPRDVALYFIERIGDDSKVYEIPLAKTGEFVKPPDRFRSFFSDDYEETLKWTETIAKILHGSAVARRD